MRQVGVDVTTGALRLDDADGWNVVRGRLFVFCAPVVDDRTGPRALVAELPAGTILVTEGVAAALEGVGLIGVPSTSAAVHPLDAASVRAHLAGDGGAEAVALTTRALWRDADAESRAAGVVPLEPGVVSIRGAAVAESAEHVVWVRRRSGSPELPDGPLPPGGALLAPRVRVRGSGGGADLDVVSLADAISRGVVTRAVRWCRDGHRSPCRLHWSEHEAPALVHILPAVSRTGHPIAHPGAQSDWQYGAVAS